MKRGKESQLQSISMVQSKCIFCINNTNCRGKTSFDQGGVGVEVPGELNMDDSAFDTYRKRMMLAYRFRPNPLVIIV